MPTMLNAKQADATLAAVREKYANYLSAYGEPVMLRDFDGKPYVILWEEGPEDWVFNLDGVAPSGVLAEPINHVALGLYPS